MTLATHLERSLPWCPFEIGSQPFMRGTKPENWLVNQFLLMGGRALVVHFPYYKLEEGQTSNVQFSAFKDAKEDEMIYLRLDTLLLLSRDPTKIVVWELNGIEEELYCMTVLQDGCVRINQWMPSSRNWRITFLPDEWAYILREIEAIAEQGHHTSSFPNLKQLSLLTFPLYRLPGGCLECEAAPGKCTCEKAQEEEEEQFVLNEHGQRKYGWSTLSPFETIYGNHVYDGLLISEQKIITGRFSEPMRSGRRGATRWWDRAVSFTFYEDGIEQREAILPHGLLKILHNEPARIIPEQPGSMEKKFYRLHWDKQHVTLEMDISWLGQEPRWVKDRFPWKLWQFLVDAIPDFIADWSDLRARGIGQLRRE